LGYLHFDLPKLFCGIFLKSACTKVYTNFYIAKNGTERIHGKDEVTSSTLVEGSSENKGFRGFTSEAFMRLCRYAVLELKINVIKKTKIVLSKEQY